MREVHKNAYLDYADEVEASLLGEPKATQEVLPEIEKLRKQMGAESPASDELIHRQLCYVMELADLHLSPFDDRALVVYDAQCEAEKALANESYLDWVLLNNGLRDHLGGEIARLYPNQLLPDDGNQSRKSLEGSVALAHSLVGLGEKRGVDPAVLQACEPGPQAAFDPRRVFLEPLGDGQQVGVRYNIDTGLAGAKLMAILPASEVEGQALSVVNTAREVFYQGGADKPSWSDAALCAYPKETTMQATLAPLVQTMTPLILQLEAISDDAIGQHDPALKQTLARFSIATRSGEKDVVEQRMAPDALSM